MLADRPAQGSFLPLESSWLAGLRAVVKHSVRTYVSGVQQGREVTLDVDAHLVESSKAEALPTYQGFRGYQPMLVAWAETMLVLADEFRDGNVPASVGILDIVDRAYGSLPSREEGWQVAVRSESAACEQAVLDHWAEKGWRFAVSADMTKGLRQEVQALPPGPGRTGARKGTGWCGSGRRSPLCRAAAPSSEMPTPIGTWRSGWASPREGSSGMVTTPSTSPW